MDKTPFDAHKGILHHSEGVDLLPSTIELSGNEAAIINATVTATAVVNEEEILVSCEVELKKDDLTSYPNQFVEAYANTESPHNEYKENLIDGDITSFWHTQYSFGVSETNPAIVTVKLKEEAQAHNGFRFSQRPSGDNGLVQKFKYIVGNTFDEASIPLLMEL